MAPVGRAGKANRMWTAMLHTSDEMTSARAYDVPRCRKTWEPKAGVISSKISSSGRSDYISVRQVTFCKEAPLLPRWVDRLCLCLTHLNAVPRAMNHLDALPEDKDARGHCAAEHQLRAPIENVGLSRDDGMLICAP